MDHLTSLHWLTSAPHLQNAVHPAYSCSEFYGVAPAAANWSSWSHYTKGLYVMVGRANPVNNWTGTYGMWKPNTPFWRRLPGTETYNLNEEDRQVWQV